MKEQPKHPAKIHWAPRLPPGLLKRLYESDARGVRDEALCDEVGVRLFERCRTFYLTNRHEVECPACGCVFAVSQEGENPCPGDGCNWSVSHETYWVSVRNHYAYTGRAVAAFVDFYRRYSGARTYQDKIILIDQLIHSYHRHEVTKVPTKSVASKLLEGNKKEVVRFLDHLSAIDAEAKAEWRRIVATTIDAGEIGRRDK